MVVSESDSGGHSLRLVLDLRAYRLTAIKKSAYRLAERCTAIIGSVDNDRVEVTLRFKPGSTEDVAQETQRLFFQELLDQELREHVAEETFPIRSLILAQAFSRVDLIKRNG